jgi:hypothetical protein
MTPHEADELLWRSTGIVALVLAALTVGIVLIRVRWPVLAVRVVTSILLLLSFLLSAGAVTELVQSGIMAREEPYVFVAVHPGHLQRWLPAVIAALVGITAFRRATRRKTPETAGV